MSFNVGISTEAKNSSRVLKPPGGGHSDIFGPPEQKPRAPRYKNDQQNSSMMCEIMGKDAAAAPPPSFQAEPVHVPEPVQAPAPVQASEPAPAPAPAPAPTPAARAEAPPKAAQFEQTKENPSTRVRVPPGGFSSGLW